MEELVDSTEHALGVEEIQDAVEEELMKAGLYKLARNYTVYRYKREIARKSNTTDEQILSLIERNNEEVKQENSNKNPTINSVQRDYMAGEVSKDLTRRFLLPPDIVQAHEEGLIQFHDSDYYAQHMHNCCLVNLEDMLQNGTVISGTGIEYSSQLFYRLQHCNTGDCAGGKFTVWRTDDYSGTFGSVRTDQP